MHERNVIELQLESMAHGGEALGRHGGRVVFVPYAIPGEVVRAVLVDERKRWARAELREVLQPSPHRVTPPCPYFGLCGGCQWQHINYQAQLGYKQQIVAEQLQRIGHLPDAPVRPVTGMDEPWFYRNHVQMGLAGGETTKVVTTDGPVVATSAPETTKVVTTDGPVVATLVAPETTEVVTTNVLGFQAAQSHEVIPVAFCRIMHPLLGELHRALQAAWSVDETAVSRVSLRAGIRTGERLCILEARGGQVPSLSVDLPASLVVRRADGSERTLRGQAAYHERLGGRCFRISASSFFQVNTGQAEELLATASAYLDPRPQDTLLDLYCGVGTLGLSLQDRVAHLIGVEEHPAAVADALANAGDAAHVTLIRGKAESVLPGLHEKVSKAILDPPRQGCAPEAIAALLRLRPERIVYVSCDPATLARDAVALGAGGYRLAEVQPVDMFPQTYHVETVSLWIR